MAAFPELVLLALSFGSFNSWSNDDDSTYTKSSTDVSLTTEPNMESRSLYDLMAHFPTHKDIKCPESDSRFRYPGECHRYVTCRNYQAHIRSCPPGMSFDMNYGHCRLAFEVDCDDSLQYRSMCGSNEEYSECNCESTCENFMEEDLCEDHCAMGCFCRPGFVRDSEGNCVEPDACENENSLFSALKGGV